jgi:acyl-CoA reductase-like NAD-dependent aldehyde dehydrogenase/nicotinamidase-related amidase
MKPALLLVDLQADYLATPGLQPAADALIAQSAALLAGCRGRQIPIIHIWTTVDRADDRRLPHWRSANRWQCVAGTHGHRPPACLEPQSSETIIHKSGFNAFADGELEQALRRLDCDTAILAGVHLHTCVRAAAMECMERGYGVQIAEDAVGSNDPIHAASTRRWLAGRSVEFAPVPAILASLSGTATALVHRSPRCTEQVLFEIPVAGASEIAAQSAAARAGFDAWSRTSPAFRFEVLDAAANLLEAAAPHLARQMATEIGKPLAHGLEEVRRGAGNVRDVIRRASEFAFQQREPAGAVRHQPLGVVALISPWNNPVAIPIGKIAPALAYGNTVVWKPAPAATRIAQEVLKLLREAGVPENAVRLLSGDHTTAQGLASQDNISAVTLTGSLGAGYAIQEICTRRIVPLQAELNGNNAAIVWDDADFAAAAKHVAWGAFGFAGQRCTANRRVIVNAPRFGKLLEELKAAGERLVWGDPLDETTDVGPVINIAKREETASLINRARSDSSVHAVQVLRQARAQEPWVQAGAYAQPAILCCDQPDHPLVQEETMSPILVVQRAENFDHALELCNGTRYGLAAALFSNTGELHDKFLEKVQAGILKINASTAGADVSLPFGGWKASGIGPPEHGQADRLFYTRMQAVYGMDG